MSAWTMKYALQADAQIKADAVHTWMQGSDSAYAASVSKGRTTAWAIPYFDGASWCVNIKSRSYNALSAGEKSTATVLAA